MSTSDKGEQHPRMATKAAGVALDNDSNNMVQIIAPATQIYRLVRAVIDVRGKRASWSGQN